MMNSSPTPVPASAIACAMLLLLGACGRGGTGESPGSFVLVRELPQGSWLHVRDLVGSITAEPSTDGMVHVSATTSWRGRRGQEIRFRTVDEGDGFVVCALWSERGTCSSEGYDAGPRRRGWLRWLSRRGRSTVDFEVRIPAGIALDARTENGAVRASDVPGAVVLRTVNGAVSAATPGHAIDARTVNGSVTAVIGGEGHGAIRLETVNGRVEARIPPGMGADVEMTTVNGSLTSELPLAAQSSGSRRLEGTLGGGGRPLQLRTVNGSATLRAGT